MGVPIHALLLKESITFAELRHKAIAIDASIFLYQFLTTIRQRDGNLLTDSHGNITSHLIGLFSRTVKFLEYGIRPIYIFDGKPPALKSAEQEKRRAAKDRAQKRYEQAAEIQDTAAMKRFASQTSRISPEMTTEAQELLGCLGVPFIQAPSEGEAQAASLARENLAYAVASQDADALLFGAPRLIRNLSLTGRKKHPKTLAYASIEPEMVDLQQNLQHLQISHEQLIALGMLVGTDYNRAGIKGVGPKNALKLVRQFGDNLEGLFSHVRWEAHCPTPWKTIFSLFTDMPVIRQPKISFGRIRREALLNFLVDQHDFSLERTEKQLGAVGDLSQGSLSGWV